MKETARLYFAGDDVTVNLIPATIILLLLTLGEFVRTCLIKFPVSLQ